MHELEHIPKWRLWMLVPVIGLAYGAGWVLAKSIRFRFSDSADEYLEMTQERRQLLIAAERTGDQAVESGRELA